MREKRGVQGRFGAGLWLKFGFRFVGCVGVAIGVRVWNRGERRQKVAQQQGRAVFGVWDQMADAVVQRTGQVAVVAVDGAALFYVMSNALVQPGIVRTDLGQVVDEGGLEAFGG